MRGAGHRIGRADHPVAGAGGRRGRIDASRRAKEILAGRGIVTLDESRGVSTVLNAAAWTYVAAFLSSLFHLLHLVALRNRD